MSFKRAVPPITAIGYAHVPQLGLLVPYRTQFASDYLSWQAGLGGLIAAEGLPTLVSAADDFICVPDLRLVWNDRREIVVCTSTVALFQPQMSRLEGWCIEHKHELRVVSSKDLPSQNHLENLRSLALFASEEVLASEEASVIGALDTIGEPITIADLLSIIRPSDARHYFAVVLHLAYQRLIGIDLETNPLSARTRVSSARKASAGIAEYASRQGTGLQPTQELA